jgi:hypothetical protein
MSRRVAFGRLRKSTTTPTTPQGLGGGAVAPPPWSERPLCLLRDEGEQRLVDLVGVRPEQPVRGTLEGHRGVERAAGRAGSRIRPCAAEDCQHFLIDESRANARNWHSMETCGNREKARRHYAKTKLAAVS